ncbi:hypothetical protein QQ020_15730 [Fulvivirgaceae bacterium BMA12]|uniref:Lipocalin-like domain-containing protein n=1 Tax=Agaribacillus aureus TaxID=3051825 RepID=A0ABT8L8X5_9BACT|nr:hypothetical protein [Fulvivirgaceae bacterium BMA12]
MKRNFLILALLFFAGFIAGCENDEDITPDQQLNGSWHLTNVSGGLAGVNIDYKKGEVKWDFDPKSGNLTIENLIDSTGPEDIYAGLDSGTYPYEIRQEGDAQVLYIDNSERGILTIVDNTLKIDDGLIADGFITQFER